MRLRPQARSWIASTATHTLAAGLGGALVLAFGVESRTAIETQGVAACPAPEDTRRAVACVSPPVRLLDRDDLPSGPAVVQPDGRTLLLELRNASSESALRELGGMPLAWSDVLDVPEGLLPERFHAVVAGVLVELGMAEPDIDCSEFPCVVVAPPEWTEEQFANLRARVQDEVHVDDAQAFGIDQGSSRVFGVYSSHTATPAVLERIWFRMQEHRRDAIQEGEE